MAAMQLENYSIADTFLLRVPSMPLNILDEISDADELEEVLRKYYSNPILAEALLLASPGMYRETTDWLNGGRVKGKHGGKFLFTLLKYLIRIASRCTPFGTFAGICCGSFSDQTSLSINSQDSHQVFARPDMQYLVSLSEQLQKDKKLRDHLMYYPNSSLYSLAETYRYLEYSTAENGIREYQLQSVGRSNELEKIIERSDGGASIREIAETIAGNGISVQNVVDYIHTLIDNQVLVSELEPSLTGKPFLRSLRDRLAEVNTNSTAARELEDVTDLFKDIHHADPGKRIRLYQNTWDLVKDHHTQSAENTMVQVDKKVSLDRAFLSNGIRNELEEVLAVLMKMSRNINQGLLYKFRRAFEDRYGGAEIPLAIALDSETGPGYLPNEKSAHASSILSGIHPPGKKIYSEELEWTSADSYLLGRLQRAIIAGKSHIEIRQNELGQFGTEEKVFPMCFAILGRLCGSIPGLQDKLMISLSSVGGSSALNLAGRFSHMDRELYDSLKMIADLEQEQAGEDIIAEIVHLPQKRTGNILMRTVLRDYEIPYVARSAVDHEHSIRISDLMLSVKKGKFVLRSKKLNRNVIPRMSNAHNYSNGSVPIYRFLCDLQSQDINTGIGFSWGPLERFCPYLPRVSYKNFILQAATWNMKKEDLADIQQSNSDEELERSLTALRKKFNIPAEVVMADTDNELWLNLESRNCMRLFRNEIKSASNVCLQEFLFDRDTAIISNENGAFANEIIFFVQHNK